MKVLPDDIPALIEELEKLYKPRCMDPCETLEQHLRYAGSVALVQTLRDRLDATERAAAKRNQLRT